MLAGFSMGTGEVTRYLGTYGSAGVSKAALLGVIPPFLLQTDDNPKGVPGSVFDGSRRRSSRTATPTSTTSLRTSTTSMSWRRTGSTTLRCGRASRSPPGSGPYASYACVDAWLTDFRADLPRIDVPTLVVHGSADRILPFQATAARLLDEALIADLTVVAVEDGPHNIGWTHPDEVNHALLDFLAD